MSDLGFLELAIILLWLAGTAVLGLAVGVGVYVRRKRCFELVAHFSSAEARRAAHPAEPRRHPSLVSPEAFAGCQRESGFFEGMWWQAFIPSEPTCLVVGVHGYADHSDFTMMNHAEELVRQTSAVVVLFDQPGFGRSDGLWAFIPNWFLHVGSCRRFLEFAKAKFPGQKMFGLGYSMGGGILTTIEALQPILDGMVLLAPMLVIRDEMKPPAFLWSALQLLAQVFPTWPVAVSGHNGQLSYRNPAFRAKEQEMNKLSYPGYPRLGTAVSMLAAQNWLEENCGRVDCPFLILHGTADVVTSLEGSRLLLSRTRPGLDKQLVTMDGYRHCILGPSQDWHFNEKPYTLICEWLLARSQS